MASWGHQFSIERVHQHTMQSPSEASESVADLTGRGAPPPYQAPGLSVAPVRVAAAGANGDIPPTYGVAMGTEEAPVSPPTVQNRCAALTHRGSQCARLSMATSEYCVQHQQIFDDPVRHARWVERQQEMQEARDLRARREEFRAMQREADRVRAVREYMSGPADGFFSRQAQLAQDGYRQRLAIRRQDVERWRSERAREQRVEEERREEQEVRNQEQFEQERNEARVRYDSPEQRRLDRQHRQQQKEFEEEIEQATVRAAQAKWEKQPWFVRWCTVSPELKAERERKAKQQKRKRNRRGRARQSRRGGGWCDEGLRNQMAQHASMAMMTAGVD